MHSFTDHFLSTDQNLAFAKATMMGPNAMRVAEELASHLDIRADMRILDLGCGMGLSSLLLARKYGAQVFAADLWIAPTENYERFKALGIDRNVVPVSVDATKGLPFADGYFDLLFSVDAYHYFGDTADMLPSLIPYVKRGGHIAVALPGIRHEFGAHVPEEMKPFWNDEVARTIHSRKWWTDLWARETGIELIDERDMRCCKQAWDEWIAEPIVAQSAKMREIIEEDARMMAAEDGKYFTLVQMIARVIV